MLKQNSFYNEQDWVSPYSYSRHSAQQQEAQRRQQLKIEKVAKATVKKIQQTQKLLAES